MHYKVQVYSPRKIHNIGFIGMCARAQRKTYMGTKTNDNLKILYLPILDHTKPKPYDPKLQPLY